MDEIIKGSPTYLAKTVMAIPQVKNCVFEPLLKSMNVQCQKLCTRSNEYSSVLRVSRKSHKSINSFHWIDVLKEMRKREPDIVTIAIAKINKDGSQVTLLCVADSRSCHWCKNVRQLLLVQVEQQRR